MPTPLPDPSRYGPLVADLVRVDVPPELGPGTPRRQMENALRKLSPALLFGDLPIGNPDLAQGCLAGLWLLHGFLDESHSISQEIHSPTGSYWHGIMHRREPDYGNAKYWFRRVGRHPIYGQLWEAVQADRQQYTSFPEWQTLLDGSAWDPFAFVDLCERAARREDPLQQTVRYVTHVEWRLLFDYCFQQAAG